MQVERTDASTFVVNPLPDGSKVIIDSEHDRVVALNATAGAAWDACGKSTTLSAVTEQMQSFLGPEITEEVAEETILRLEEQNLVTTSGSRPSRRQFMTTLGTVALPLVVSLTMADQRGYADVARSWVSSPMPRTGTGEKLPIQQAPIRPVDGTFHFSPIEPGTGEKLPIQQAPIEPVKGPFHF